MTFEEIMRKNLKNRGMCDTQINEIMVAVKTAEENQSMLNRWCDNVSDYPDMMANVVWISVKRHALEWIEKNLPLAWFKPMFYERDL